jgi:CTP-dependent riboflavin kinase
MKTIVCIKDFIPAFSMSHLEKLNSEPETKYSKITKKQILNNISDAQLIEKDVVKKGESVTLIKEGYMRDFDKMWQKEFDEPYMFLVRKNNGREILIESEYFGVIKEKRKHEMKDFYTKNIEDLHNNKN